MRDDRDDDHRQEHEADREQADWAKVRAQVAQRGEERCSVEERREHADEDEVGGQIDLGQSRDEPERQPAQHEQDRIRIRSFGTSTSIPAPAVSSTSRLTRS